VSSAPPRTVVLGGRRSIDPALIWRAGLNLQALLFALELLNQFILGPHTLPQLGYFPLLPMAELQQLHPRISLLWWKSGDFRKGFYLESRYKIIHSNFRQIPSFFSSILSRGI